MKTLTCLAVLSMFILLAQLFRPLYRSYWQMLQSLLVSLSYTLVALVGIWACVEYLP